jgi:NTE family protein
MRQQENEQPRRGTPAEKNAPRNGERVGLLLSGAAARGPYQAGALAELLPTLLADGHRPVVLLGTSSGAITAALFAQFAHQPAAEAGQSLVDAWTGFGDVFRNPLSTPKPVAPVIARLLGGEFVGRFVRPTDALLDTAPLRKRATTEFTPERVADNINSGLVRSLAVAATVCPQAGSAARSRLFVQGAPPGRALRGNAVDVVPVALGVDHLLASAAIPAVFPPEYIDDPRPSSGYYIDGGVRLNAPFDAALAMGVDRLVVISGHSVNASPVPPLLKPGAPPDLAATVAIALRAILADALSDDLQSLRRKNQRVQQGAAGRLPYELVRYLLVAPKDGELAKLAARTFRPSGPTDPYWAIGRTLDALGSGIGRDELLSLIYFNRKYAEQQVDLGRQDAKAALAAGWQT